MLRALRLAAPAAGSPLFSAEVLVASVRVQSGEPLSRALRDSRVLSETTLRLMAAGESMGRLSSLVSQAARIESESAARTTTTLIRLIEPAVIVLMAGLVAFVALALMQAVYAFSPGL
jgi:type II secretory pathway component PulF